MKFYYVANYSDLYGDDERNFICEHDHELSKGDVVVIELSGKFVTLVIEEKFDELEVLVQRLSTKKIVAVVDTKSYLHEKEKQIKKQALLQELEAKSKEVKMLESLRKIAGNDEQMREMLSKYENLD